MLAMVERGVGKPRAQGSRKSSHGSGADHALSRHPLNGCNCRKKRAWRVLASQRGWAQTRVQVFFSSPLVLGVGQVTSLLQTCLPIHEMRKPPLLDLSRSCLMLKRDTRWYRTLRGRWAHERGSSSGFLGVTKSGATLSVHHIPLGFP